MWGYFCGGDRDQHGHLRRVEPGVGDDCATATAGAVGTWSPVVITIPYTFTAHHDRRRDDTSQHHDAADQSGQSPAVHRGHRHQQHSDVAGDPRPARRRAGNGRGDLRQHQRDAQCSTGRRHLYAQPGPRVPGCHLADGQLHARLHAADAGAARAVARHRGGRHRRHDDDPHGAVLRQLRGRPAGPQPRHLPDPVGHAPGDPGGDGPVRDPGGHGRALSDSDRAGDRGVGLCVRGPDDHGHRGRLRGAVQRGGAAGVG